MKRSCRVSPAWVALLAALLAGCSNRDHEATEHDEAPSAAAEYSFNAESGVFLTAAMKESLGVRTSRPVERTFLPGLRAEARVYAPGRATAFVDSRGAAALMPGGSVALGPASKPAVTGTLERLERQFETSLGHAEALITFPANEQLAVGASVPVVFTLSSVKARLAVPESSVLQTGQGSFVFVAKDRNFRRERITPGTHGEGWVEIIDGLLATDVVVTNGVQSLWCIELHGVKAGAACCPVPAK